MSNNSSPPDKNNLPEKKGEDLLNAMARIQTEQNMAEVSDGIRTFLRVVYLRQKGVIKGNFWQGELDTPTTIIDTLSDWLVTYYLILKDIKAPISGNQAEILKEIETDLEGIDPKSNYFIRMGDFWKVKYNENEIYLKNLKRLQYLIRLINHANTKIASHELVRLVSGPIEGDEQNKIYSKMSPEQLTKVGFSQLDTEDKSISEYELKKFKDAAYLLWENTERARKDLDEDKIGKCTDQWEQYVKYLTNSYGIFINYTKSGPRFYLKKRLTKRAERARKNVSKQLKNAIDDIKHKIKPLGIHLEKSIEMGGHCCYQPDEDVDWHIRW
jgi:hypothetical protein